MIRFGAFRAIAGIAVLLGNTPTVSAASASSANVDVASENLHKRRLWNRRSGKHETGNRCADTAALDLEQDAAAAREQYTCGQASLFAVARLKDVALRWSDVTRTLPAHSDGTNSLAELESAAAAAGLHAVAARVDRQQLVAINPPAILHFEVDPRPGVSDHGPAAISPSLPGGTTPER